MTVFTVAESAQPVRCNNGLVVQPRMALCVLARLYGEEIVAATARGIEYDHWPGKDFVVSRCLV